MQDIDVNNYSYELPPDRIPSHPLERREESKLLLYKNGGIDHHRFVELPSLLPSNNILFLNDTRVIPARLEFKKDTGGTIEVLLLQPFSTTHEVDSAMEQTGTSTWKCMVGNLKRWSSNSLLINELNGVRLEAELMDRDKGTVRFDWSPSTLTFSKVIASLGKTPLPPYLRRASVADDLIRYQTVYARHEGAVAAPTAGLHFTEQVLQALRLKGMDIDYLTLHVGAGTFQPIKERNALLHPMHEERLVVSRTNIENLLSGKTVTAVGTTSLRVLESIFWYGNMLAENPASPFAIPQQYPYEAKRILSKEESLERVLRSMKGRDVLHGVTSIYILPGYDFKICDILITNFHQPGSTLILLVAAFAGTGWREIYSEALGQGYRFLSYGDSSVLYRN